MQSVYELITLDAQNEHDLEHDLLNQKLFSTPKLYDANGDLSKRWDVYFSFLNLETGKLERMKNIYGKTNRYKTKEARYSILSIYIKRFLKFLQDGYNPLIDNTKHYNTKLSTKGKDIILKEKSPNIDESIVSVENAIEKALKLKINVIGDRTMVDYASRCKTKLK